ncbi:MAG: ABC transporter substrate-binding protein, partial [Gemmatimonadota bacterium]|nr:ABC transporter substrate-binding protein [Gemmatimonadota bacterium]
MMSIWSRRSHVGHVSRLSRVSRRRRGGRFGEVTAVLLLATFAGLSCAEPDDSGVRGVTDDTIVIGTWSPLTGPAALWGAVGRGAELYFDMINEEGGIHGRQIEFILKDDAYQPSRTVAAVR